MDVDDDDNGGGGGSGGAHRADAVWSAAADARTWAASIREMAARREYRMAWEAKFGAEDILMGAAELLGSAAKARRKIGTRAIGQAVAELGGAAGEAARAAAAFVRASKLGLMEADEWEEAAAACAQAAAVGRERAARMAASAALRRALEAAERSAGAATYACETRQLADKWAANAARLKRSYEFGGGRDEVAAGWFGIHAECRREWAKSTEAAGLASAEEVKAARGLEEAAAAAERAAAAVAGEPGRGGAAPTCGRP